MAGAEVEDRYASGGSADVQIAYRVMGPADGRPLLLICGLGLQLVSWPADLLAELCARSYHVAIFDNRDTGASTHLTQAGPPDLLAVLAGTPGAAAYALADMAADAAGVLDALGWASAHVAGVSMGGMIAQELAVRLPQRVRSLTSVMSTTGERAVSQPTPAAGAALLAGPVATRADYVEQVVTLFRVIGSPGYPSEDDWIRQMAGWSWDRGYDPAGVGRQLAAIYASGDRTAALRGVRVPTFVVHGAEDPLIPLAAGRATAAAIPGARLLVLPGMGHDLPRPVWGSVLTGLDEVVRRADQVGQGPGSHHPA